MATPRSVALLKHLLLFTGYPGHFPVDEEVSELTLTSWGMLQEEMAEEGLINVEGPAAGAGREVLIAAADHIRRKVQWPHMQELKSWPKGCFCCLLISYRVLNQRI